MAVIPDNQRVIEPEIWAAFSNKTNGTTNSCKSFHARLNKHFNSPHPNIFTFVIFLKGFNRKHIKSLEVSRAKKRKLLSKKKIFWEKQWIIYLGDIFLYPSLWNKSVLNYFPHTLNKFIHIHKVCIILMFIMYFSVSCKINFDELINI